MTGTIDHPEGNDTYSTYEYSSFIVNDPLSLNTKISLNFHLVDIGTCDFCGCEKISVARIGATELENYFSYVYLQKLQHIAR
jgi:hypothetical protein